MTFIFMLACFHECLKTNNMEIAFYTALASRHISVQLVLNCRKILGWMIILVKMQLSSSVEDTSMKSLLLRGC